MHNFSRMNVFAICVYNYRRVTSSNTPRLEPHPGFYRLLMKGIFDAYLL